MTSDNKKILNVEPVKPKKVKQAPNRNTFRTRPRGYQEMSKADMQNMLKQAVENTK